jgi:hypothetical protein
MTTQETLAQIEHLLVKNEETLRSELAIELLNKLLNMARCDFLNSIKDSNGKSYEEIPEAMDILKIVKRLEKIKQEM